MTLLLKTNDLEVINGVDFVRQSFKELIFFKILHLSNVSGSSSSSIVYNTVLKTVII